MAVDVWEYIWGYLFYAKWAISAQLILFYFIQTRELYKLMAIDFIGPFKKFIYDNTYIYNLVNNFLRHIYPYPTFGTGTNNVIILFDYYLQANPKFYAIYINISSYFTSQKLCTYFQKKDIAFVFTPSASHKSVSIIEKEMIYYDKRLKKMQETREESEYALFWSVSQVNSWMNKHLDYSPIKIIIRI